ncbi:MAG: 3,4-dihydroxy-2-butanone-4-phosphate synthase, partial [Nocardioidaceae bacterium]|nr:3,4-dihydroxy-2-butanone-4-phosphate synthase [Nocardioidaceae bacterium]
MSVSLDPVERAIADIAAGKAVVVVDDEDRENEGDLIFAASKATPELMAFTIRHSSGVICCPMPGDMLDRLEIPLMTPHNKDAYRTAYTLSVDARDGVSTGISAADRAHTVRVLADSATEPWELTRPGHVFPLRYREGGVLFRRGHTEAAVDLCRRHREIGGRSPGERSRDAEIGRVVVDPLGCGRDGAAALRIAPECDGRIRDDPRRAERLRGTPHVEHGVRLR